jgi:hypothetical protein
MASQLKLEEILYPTSNNPAITINADDTVTFNNNAAGAANLSGAQLIATNGIVVNSATVTADYTIPTGSHAQSAGPISVADGVTVTVSDGCNWVIS